MAYQDQDEDWEGELEKAWRSDLHELLGDYKKRISDVEERRKARGRFEGVEDFAVRVTWVLYEYAHPHGLWQLAVHFAVLAAEPPLQPSGPLDIGAVISFLCKFEMALEMLRRKHFEYQDRVEKLLDDPPNCTFNDMKIWLDLQKLPSDCVGEIVKEILELKENDPTTGEAAYRSRDNNSYAFSNALFRHIQAYIRHPLHMDWWLNSLDWFHSALMKEGEEVQREVNNNRLLSFKDASHLVLHAVKHSARMSIRSIEEYQGEAAKLWMSSKRLNGVAVAMAPRVSATVSTTYCARSKIGQTEYLNGIKEIYQESFDPPRKLVVDIKTANSVIKTFYPKPKNSDGDSGNWPDGPYDILQAERLQKYHQ